MSKRSSRRTKSNASWTGEPHYRSNPRLPRPSEYSQKPPRMVLRPKYSPMGAFKPQVVYYPSTNKNNAAKSRPNAFNAMDLSYPSPVLKIRAPRRVHFCLQRNKRREVLFALRRAGFSGSAKKRHYRRTQNSQWRC